MVNGKYKLEIKLTVYGIPMQNNICIANDRQKPRHGIHKIIQINQ